jgi:hypothetical protein
MWIALCAMQLLLSLGIVLRNRTAVQAFSAAVTRRTKHACPIAGSGMTNRWFATTLNDDMSTATAVNPSGESAIVPAVAATRAPRSKRGFKQRKTHQHTVPVDPNLDWERFEFSESPKWDRRFDADTILVSQNHTLTLATDNDGSDTASRILSKQDALEKLVQIEAAHDAEYTQSLQQRQAMWDQLDPTVVQRAIATIQPCINPDRVAKIERVLARRTRHTRFLFESTSYCACARVRVV